MKKLFLITILSFFLNASEWCPVTGLKISDYIETSYQAKLQSNDNIRTYASLYALLKDKENYGLYDYRKYDVKTKTYLHVEIPDTLHVDKNPMAEVYKKRYYPMGKKLYQKRCPHDIDLDDYFEISDLKEDLQSRCNLDSEMYLHAVAVYLWDVKRVGGIVFNEKKIHVTKDEKCPVCGMYVYKYPRWAAQIYYADKHYSFDGVKDMMKWYFKHKEGIVEIKVSDYYSQHAIDGTKAFYVIGSDTYGPMGHELIPFLEIDDAKNFKEDHHGKVILKFDEIKRSLSVFEK
ncbi:nosL-related protein [hydrothermal vent metagenome]|uniref:NosL-related protein n=1 Tax=hydrothermal vent metagenome TaxID=652676 RepID=A0A3B1EAA8_9ZZZZ